MSAWERAMAARARAAERIQQASAEGNAVHCRDGRLVRDGRTIKAVRHIYCGMACTCLCHWGDES
jgi:hypothetical protein